MPLKNLLSSGRFYTGVVLVILLFIAFGRLFNRSQNDFVPVHTDETKTILLEKSFDPSQLIIFEDERVVVSIGYDQYLSYKNSDAKNPLFSHIVESHSNEIESSFANGFLPKDFSARSDFIIEMLDAGKATIYDKQAKKEITSIVEHYQNYICGPLCGEGNINFYFLDGTLLYKGPEWNF